MVSPVRERSTGNVVSQYPLGRCVILVILWLLGWLVGNIGPFIHILLVIAVIVLLYNLFVGGRARL